MSSNVNTAWKNDLYPLVSKTFDYEYANKMILLKSIVGEEYTDSVDYRIAGMGGYGELPDYDGTLKSLNQSRGFLTVITPTEKAGAIDIKRKYARNDKSGEAKKTGKRAASTAYMTVYRTLLRMFGNAFSTDQLGADGKPWAATDHPVATKGDANGRSIADPDSGTFSNLYELSLSVASITKMQTEANRFKTPDGMPFACDYNTLLVSPELEGKAKELCGVDGKIVPEQLQESAENGANPIYGMKYIVVGGGSDGFSAKQWAVCDRDLMQETVKIVYNEKPTVLRTKLDDPLVDRYVPYVDFGIGFGDARVISFSKGK